MKKSIFAISLAFFSMLLFLRFNLPEEKAEGNNVNRTAKFKIPDDIQPIIKKSCFGCHNSTSKNDKAKAKLQFDQLEKMKKKELAGLMGEINEVVTKGEMPPPKFLEKFEQAKPTDEEKQKLITWTQTEGDKMMKKKKRKNPCNMRKATWITVVIVILIQFINSRLPETASRGNKDITVSDRLPMEVQELLVKACYNCHSMETKFPWYSHIAPVKWLLKSDILGARHHVNFSYWADYTGKEKFKKLGDLHEEVEKGDMPPSKYILMHSSARLSDSDRRKIISWADSTANHYLE